MLSDLERARLVDEHETLAKWFASRYEHRGLEYDDALQEARIAVWSAAAAFDTDRGGNHVTFSMYARTFIIRALQKALVKSRMNGFTATGGRRPKRASQQTELAGEPRASGSEMETAVHVALSTLDEVSKAILVRRYGLDGGPPWTVIECAFQFDKPVGTVKKILADARADIEAELNEAGWDPSRWCAPGGFYVRIANS